MTESVQPAEDAAAARAAEQTRLRKERREAKIKAGGSARLNKITGLGGGVQRDPPTAPPADSATTTGASPSPAQTPAPSGQQDHDDPEEVIISEHHYTPRQTPRFDNNSEAQLRQMMMGLDRPSPAASGPATPGGMPPGAEEDPMMKMLSQMMGGGAPGAGGGPPGANPFAGTPMESLFAGAANNMGQQQQQQQVPPHQQQASRSASLWRIAHGLFALGLGLYVALTTTFAGTFAERQDPTAAASFSVDSGSDFDGTGGLEPTRAYFFYLFTSVEALLLTTRFMIDSKTGAAAVPPPGMLGTAIGFLPAPYGRYVLHALRYFQILTTVRSDALACVLVLGVCCWLRS